jgi:hypothetical protein
MDTPDVYSQAARCEKCDMRALLGEETAHALVGESVGRLEMYRCPYQDGWHVWNPRDELDSAHRPRLP